MHSRWRPIGDPPERYPISTPGLDIAKNLIKRVLPPHPFKKQLGIIIRSAIYKSMTVLLMAIAHAIYKTGKISKGNGFA
jgi:hypothetical protein